MKKKLLIIDSLNVCYRNFVKMPVQLKNRYGLRTNVIFGFFRSLQKVWMRNSGFEYVICVFDNGKNSARKRVCKEYKSNRKKKDMIIQEFFEQVRLLKEVLRRIGIDVVEIEGCEADDVIAYVVKCLKCVLDITILSTDRDLLQLVDKNVKITTNGDKVIDLSEVRLKFGGIGDWVVMVRALVGDKSDGLDGVKGVGDATAVKIVNTCKGRVDTVIRYVKSKYGVDMGKLVLRNYWLMRLPFDELLEQLDKFFNNWYLSKLKLDREELMKVFYEYDIMSIDVNDFLNESKM